MREIEKCFICFPGVPCTNNGNSSDKVERYAPQLKEEVLINKDIYDCPIFRRKMITKEVTENRGGLLNYKTGEKYESL